MAPRLPLPRSWILQLNFSALDCHLHTFCVRFIRLTDECLSLKRLHGLMRQEFNIRKIRPVSMVTVSASFATQVTATPFRKKALLPSEYLRLLHVVHSGFEALSDR